MKIGIDASRANTVQRTGVENYAFFVIQELKKIISVEHQVFLYSREKLEEKIAQLPDHWSSNVLKTPGKKLWTQLRLSWEMLRRPTDVLFVPAHVMPLIHPKKTIAVIHDVAALRFPKSYSLFERWYNWFATKLAVKRAWKIVVPSQFTKDEILELFPVVRAEKIIVVAEGYDHMQFNLGIDSTVSAQVLVRLGISKPYIFFVGRLEDKKNIVTLVRAYNHFRKRNYAQLVLGGKPGYGYEKIKHVIEQSPYKKDIIELGFVAQEDLPHLYAGAKAFSFATKYEGFGIPVLEAQACGAPAIIRRGSACAEIGGAAQVGESVEDLAAALENIFNQEHPKITKVDQYSWQLCAQNIANIILSSRKNHQPSLD